MSKRPAASAFAIRRAGSFAVHARHASSTTRSSAVSFRPSSGASISPASAAPDHRGFTPNTISCITTPSAQMSDATLAFPPSITSGALSRRAAPGTP